MTTLYLVSSTYRSDPPYFYDTEAVAARAAEDLLRSNGVGTIKVEEFVARSAVSRLEHKPTRYWYVFFDASKKVVRQQGEP